MPKAINPDHPGQDQNQRQVSAHADEEGTDHVIHGAHHATPDQ